MAKKHIFRGNTVTEIILAAEKEAIADYRVQLAKCDQDTERNPVCIYDFNRGFEYGIHWALDNIEWLAREGKKKRLAG